MNKIVFFDIDGTLFNPMLFLDNFYLVLSENFDIGKDYSQKLQLIYEQTRNENGYFIPSIFLEQISKEFPQIAPEKLRNIFWDIDLIKKSMHKDTSALPNVSKLAKIGIFSKGDKQFQERKISLFGNYINKENVYIFPNKIAEINEVFEKYSDYKVFLIDDKTEVIENVKRIMPNVFAILVDRSDNYVNNPEIMRIKNLDEIEATI